jgi:hypothetical protein
MNKEDYKIKYLKYKQKYTNALHNMQGGENQMLTIALASKPDVVFVVKKEAYEALKEAYEISGDSGSTNMGVDKDVIKAGLFMADENAISIIPMMNFYETETQHSLKVFGKKLSLGQSRQYFKGGIEKVNGKSAPYKHFSFRQFGVNSENSDYNYDKNIAKVHLTDAETISYFSTTCEIVEPRFLILRDKIMYFCMSNA